MARGKNQTESEAESGKIVNQYYSKSKDYYESQAELAEAQAKQSKEKQKTLKAQESSVRAMAQREAAKAEYDARVAMAQAESFTDKVKAVTPFVIGAVAAAVLGSIAFLRRG